MQKYFPYVEEIARILKKEYLDLNHYNKKNPLNELIFIICSLRTEEYNYLYTYRAIKKRYPKFSDLLLAPEEEIAETIKFGGLSRIKARQIKGILTALNNSFGRPTLAPLRKMEDRECEKFLLSLPGVGLKAARCVMMYSLGRQTFPIDTHIWRVTRRLGWNKADYEYNKRKNSDMDYLQESVPPQLRYSLHVNFISHGRSVCTFSNPKCDICPISHLCPRINVTVQT